MKEELIKYDFLDSSIEDSLIDVNNLRHNSAKELVLEMYDVNNLRYTPAGKLILNIEVRNEKMLKIKFDWFYSFRIIDEGNLLKMLYQQKGALTAGIYTVNNSNYLKWFNEQSYGWQRYDKEIMHYLIATYNDVVDVISSVKPIITLSK